MLLSTVIFYGFNSKHWVKSHLQPFLNWWVSVKQPPSSQPIICCFINNIQKPKKFPVSQNKIQPASIFTSHNLCKIHIWKTSWRNAEMRRHSTWISYHNYFPHGYVLVLRYKDYIWRHIIHKMMIVFVYLHYFNVSYCWLPHVLCVAWQRNM